VPVCARPPVRPPARPPARRVVGGGLGGGISPGSPCAENGALTPPACGERRVNPASLLPPSLKMVAIAGPIVGVLMIVDLVYDGLH